jgi:hypothetical protein
MVDAWLTFGDFDDSMPVRTTQQDGDYGIEAVHFVLAFYLLSDCTG